MHYQDEERFGRPRERVGDIADIVSFVQEHPESYASLAVCRRSLDTGIPQITTEVIQQLKTHLDAAPDEEIAAYWDIVM